MPLEPTTGEVDHKGDALRRRRGRSWAILIVLFGLCLLFYAITIVKMAAAHDCHHKHVMIDGKTFRTVNDACWDIGRRIEAMSDMGIARQVLADPAVTWLWRTLREAEAAGLDGAATVRRAVVSGRSRIPAN